MKRIVSLLLSVVLLVGCVFTLVSCGNAYPKLKKAFEKEGYKVNETLDSITNDLKTELERENFVVEIHLLSKNLISNVVIIEFKTTEDLVNAYKDSKTMQGFVKDVKDNEDVKEMYKALEDAGYVKENCICVPLSLNVNEVTNIVKKA